MSDNCPKCGFELKDFYTKKIELELKKNLMKNKKNCLEILMKNLKPKS